MLTDFGRVLRKLRIDRGEIIKDMAEKLRVTASYLSAVETGKRNVPPQWPDMIITLYGLGDKAAEELRRVAFANIGSLRLDIENVRGQRRETAILFAREFEGIDDDTITKIGELLRKGSGGGE